jgi:hypothetical protein
MIRTTWVEDERVSSEVTLSPVGRNRQDTHLSPSAEFVIIIAALSRGCYRVIVVWKFR